MAQKEGLGTGINTGKGLSAATDGCKLESNILHRYQLNATRGNGYSECFG